MAARSERTRRVVGLVLWILGVGFGVVIALLGTFGEIVTSKNPGAMGEAVMLGAVSAFAMLFVYLPVPLILQRFDPEPWWALALAFIWGAFAATGVAGIVNTVVHAVVASAMGGEAGMFVATVFSAPFIEEIMKGVGVLGFLVFLRREFDGVVDGIIYATFCALGFAAVENVQYYARAALQGDDVFYGTFFLRGIVAPWGHPLYTSMTGIGIGIARETTSSAVRFLAPLAGLACAMFLHAVWNFVPNLGAAVFFVSLLFWFVFVFAFFVLFIVLIVRKGKTIRQFLEDEVVFGNLSREELTFVTGAFSRMKTYFMPRGRAWRGFIQAAGRLALAKWHTARAMKGKKRTISIEHIAPLRAELARLRIQIQGR